MSAPTVVSQVRQWLRCHIGEKIDTSSLERLTLLVVGIMRAESASPARIARALDQLGLSEAKPASIERRIRRIENDPEINAALCLHPTARHHLLWGRPQQLLLVIDPTTQDDRVVMVSVGVWYRGRTLPLAWAIWPANTPLTGDGFWTRVAALLDLVAKLLPARVQIIWLADRAFGTPAFTDLLIARGWYYVVRVQSHTRCRDRCSVERAIGSMVQGRGRRVKLWGEVFKKRGWREASVVVYWGRHHKKPLCLVSNLPPSWWLIGLYRRRYPIEATFRDYKSYGWHWEQGQVTDLAHLERLLVGMALATWAALMAGTQMATELLTQPATGRRRTVPWEGKRSLFYLGLHRLQTMMTGTRLSHIHWRLTGWDAPNWQSEIYSHHARAFVFAGRSHA
jgi:hypothetical protein